MYAYIYTYRTNIIYIYIYTYIRYILQTHDIIYIYIYMICVYYIYIIWCDIHTYTTCMHMCIYIYIIIYIYTQYVCKHNVWDKLLPTKLLILDHPWSEGLPACSQGAAPGLVESGGAGDVKRCIVIYSLWTCHIHTIFINIICII